LSKQAALPRWPHRWCLTQARLKETEGDLDGALALLEEGERLYIRGPVPDVQPIDAQKASLWAAQGKLAKARAWAHEQGLSVTDDLSYLREFEHITLARTLIAQSKHDQEPHYLQEALDLLQRLLHVAQAGGRMGSAIAILVQTALAHEAQDDTSLAITSLTEALTLAAPEGYVRIFVDEGPALMNLLTQTAAQGIMPDYARKLLATFATEKEKIADKSEASNLTAPTAQPLVEPLSERELEALRLLAQGLSNREIGERLFLALPTVKGHNRNIYSKLQVKRRTEAVARARELGIL
jgi:LuxR family maltose regulon positive regulatory protein